jgi:glycolate oxidase FAD binding subunit
MAIAMGSSAEVSGAAHLPQGVADRIAGGALGPDAATLLRVEGFGPSVDYRISHLKDLLKEASIDELGSDRSRAVWRDVRDCIAFADAQEKPVWRVSMAPSRGHRMVYALHMQAAVEAFYDWQGGLIWLRIDGEPEAGSVRQAVASHGGGHATLVRASPADRAAIPAFEPQPPALAALSARLKEQFDPQGILNPGRMT